MLRANLSFENENNYLKKHWNQTHISFRKNIIWEWLGASNNNFFFERIMEKDEKMSDKSKYVQSCVGLKRKTFINPILPSEY